MWNPKNDWINFLPTGAARRLTNSINGSRSAMEAAPGSGTQDANKLGLLKSYKLLGVPGEIPRGIYQPSLEIPFFNAKSPRNNGDGSSWLSRKQKTGRVGRSSRWAVSRYDVGICFNVEKVKKIYSKNIDNPFWWELTICSLIIHFLKLGRYKWPILKHSNCTNPNSSVGCMFFPHKGCCDRACCIAAVIYHIQNTSLSVA